MYEPKRCGAGRQDDVANRAELVVHSAMRLQGPLKRTDMKLVKIGEPLRPLLSGAAHGARCMSSSAPTSPIKKRQCGAGRPSR